MKPVMFSLVLLTLMVVACTPAPKKQMSTSESCPNGYSGMANIDYDSYLVVHDKKPHHPGDRLSIIRTFKDRNFTVTPVAINDWKHADGPSSDLEAVCKIPGRIDEFLAVESGQWDGKFGRLFHFRLHTSSKPIYATVIHAYDLPVFDPKGPNDLHGDEFEGLECAYLDQDRVLLVLGERGGSQAYTHGLLRWATLDLVEKNLSWTTKGAAGKTIHAPGVWGDNTRNRDINALYLDDDQILWAIASQDAGDTGPFKSLLYRVGTVTAGDPDPIELFNAYAVKRRTDGLKIEALAGPSSTIPQSAYSIATEDECFGGVWRPLN